jgi:dihydrofolate reductase
MRKVALYMTVTLDGFIAGPNNELDWMAGTSDQELNHDIVAILKRFDAGFIGYPTASGMIPYWLNAAKDPSTSEQERAVAEVVNKMHVIIVSNKEEELPWVNAELLLVKSDADIIEAVSKFKQQPGKDLGVPGGVRTAQKFARLGLLDEYILMVHPVTIGDGKRLFTVKANLHLVGSKAYDSGVVCLRYNPIA